MTGSTQSWKLSLPCTRAEADAIAADLHSIDLEPVPVLMTTEPDPAHPNEWRLDAYFESRPNSAAITAIRSIVPSAAAAKAVIEELPDEDWVTLSQAGLEPIKAGRFFVHTSTHRNAVPFGSTSFEIEAGQAFGTGQHHTTTSCLLMLDKLKRQGARFDAIADVGTGTGLLAFAAHRLWPTAEVIASDIDPIAMEVAADNARVNAVALGTWRGSVELVTAAGLAHRRLQQKAPYDLIIANILAGPLIDLAPVFASALMPGGTIILAGLLDSQADRIAQAYRRQRMRLAERLSRDEWPTLRMVKRH